MLKVVGICPTFRQPALLQNLVAGWMLQDYPSRHLIILDDDPTFDDNQKGEGWELHAVPDRFPSLPAKFNHLLTLLPHDTDAVLVIETDDIYLPCYVSSHVAALAEAEFSKSDVVLSDYTQQIAIEGSRGRFHSSLAFRRELIERIGGWPDTKRADFDQQLMSKLYSQANGVAKPWPDDATLDQIPFIYRWHSGAAHCQSTMNKGPDDETWYDRGEQAYAKVPFVAKLIPQLDEFSKRVLSNRNISFI